MHPFTLTLPMESRQMLTDSSSVEPSMSMMFSQYNYSYNPNGKPQSDTPPNVDGRHQKLMDPPLDTIIGGYSLDSFVAPPQSTSIDPSHIPLTPRYGYRMGFDSGHAEAMYKSSFGGSGNITFQDLEFGNRSLGTELNPGVLEIAAASDLQRKYGTISSPLDGIELTKYKDNGTTRSFPKESEYTNVKVDFYNNTSTYLSELR
ncbi:hypothetical protein LTS12_026361 [Elasticomyces elasticus]|nr:hypothetical protein LTS12_026361 [Elasticomyces elasticus]